LVLVRPWEWSTTSCRWSRAIRPDVHRCGTSIWCKVSLSSLLQP